MSTKTKKIKTDIKMVALNINLSQYPMLNNIKDTELDKIVFEIFNMGYKSTFPTVEDTKNNQTNQMILNQMMLLRQQIDGSNIVNKVNDIVNPLSTSLNKLVGLQTASCKKGELGEVILANIFTSRFGDIIYEDMSKVDHSGDAWITLPNKIKIMIESKNYSNQIGTKEVNKMELDMKHNHIRFCLFLSLNSPIQNFREMDFHTFNHNNETYFAIMVSNLSNDLSKLDLAFTMIRKLSDLMSEPDKFPWIQEKIKKNLDKLNEIRSRSYSLKDNYLKLDSTINSALDSFYKDIRDYIWDLDIMMKDFTNEINQTLIESIESKKDYSIINIVNTYKDKPIFNALSSLGSIMEKKKWHLKKFEENKYEIFNKSLKIGKLEIQNKRAIVNIPHNELNIVFNANNKKQNSKSLEILEKNF